MRRFLSQLMPFVFIGVVLVVLAFGIFILAYLFIIGAIVGSVLFLIAWVRQKFFPPKINPLTKSTRTPPPKKGRVIDADDWKKW